MRHLMYTLALGFKWHFHALMLSLYNYAFMHTYVHVFIHTYTHTLLFLHIHSFIQTHRSRHPLAKLRI